MVEESQFFNSQFLKYVPDRTVNAKEKNKEIG